MAQYIITITQSDGRKPGNAAESGHKPTANKEKR